MTKKKKYEAPQMKANQVKPSSIICTSGSINVNGVEFEDYQDGEFSW